MHPYKILVVEDDDADLELLASILETGECLAEIWRVQSREEMSAALERQSWDAVVSDYHLPGFSGLEALELVLQKTEDLPFVFWTGTIGEESAAACMKAGANDFVLKGQGRIVPALHREIQEAAGRRAFRANLEQYRIIVEEASEGIFLAQADGRITFANSRLRQMLQCAEDELRGSSILDRLASPYQDSVQAVLAMTELKEHMAAQMTRRDGSALDILLSLRTLRDGSQLGIVTDVTLIKTLQTRLQSASKMDAIGRMAASVAHDFKNTLGVILGFSELLAQELTTEDQHELLSNITSAATKANSMIRQMLAVGREQEMHLEIFSLNNSIRDLHRIILRAAGTGDTQVFLRLQARPDLIEFDPDMLSQVLLNLVINARDAILAGTHRGKIVVWTKTMTRAESVFCELTLPAADYVVLSVSDNGAGMEPDTLQRVFEPFFTTKDPGKGTGLGLSSVYGIVQQSRGYISVRSSPGEGTTFSIYLPLAECLPPHVAVDVPRDNDALLVMAQQAPDYVMIAETLHLEGIRYLRTDSLETCGDRVSYVIVDVAQVCESVLEVVKKVKQLGSGARLLFLASPGREFCSLPDPGIYPYEVLEKPFSQGRLVMSLRRGVRL